MPRLDFVAWKRQVNQQLVARCGMDSDCLPDAPYYDWWYQRCLPENAAKRAIKLAKES